MILSSRDEWLYERRKGIGGSEASAVLGLNPYMSNVDLYEIKTGLKEPKDISDKEYVQYGIKAEEHMRELFTLDYPQYAMYYREYEIIQHPKYPFLFCTLDGQLTEISTGRKGVYEGKTTEILLSYRKENWKDRVPDNYYVQVLHNMLVTGFEFAYLNARLRTTFQGEVSIQEKRYKIEREEVKDDIALIEEKEIKFWQENVLARKSPNLILPKL